MHSSLRWQAEDKVAYHVAIASRHMCATWRARNVKAGQRGAPGRRRRVVHDVHLAHMFWAGQIGHWATGQQHLCNPKQSNPE